MGQWFTNTVPQTGIDGKPIETLVTWTPLDDPKEKHVSRAVFIPFRRYTDEDLGIDTSQIDPGDWEEAPEELGSYWIPEGWYERIDNPIQGRSYIEIEGRVIAWQFLPKPYQPQRPLAYGEMRRIGDETD